MTRDERYELLAKQRAAYGYSELLPMRDSSRTVFIVPFLEREFFYICRCKEIKRRDAKMLWAMFQFISKADNIGPDEKSLEMIRNGVPAFVHLSDKVLRQYLYKLEELHFTYKTNSSYKPWAPTAETKSEDSEVDWKSRALSAESKLNVIYGTVVRTIH